MNRKKYTKSIVDFLPILYFKILIQLFENYTSFKLPNTNKKIQTTYT